MVDTPAHGDNGCEVECVAGMIEGANLVINAGKGPLAQLEFILVKALQYNWRPILLLDKAYRIVV